MSSIKTSVVHKNYHYFTTRKKELRGLSDLPKPTPCQCHDLDLGKPSPPSPTLFSTLFKIWAAWGCVLLKLSSPWACRTARPLDRVIFSTLSGTIFAISSPWVRTLLSVLAWPASLLDCTCFFQLFWPRQPLHSRLVGTRTSAALRLVSNPGCPTTSFATLGSYETSLCVRFLGYQTMMENGPTS